MRNMKIEIADEMKDVQVFESMWDYVDHYGSDITHYVIEPCHSEQDKFVEEIVVSDDVDFGAHDTYEIGGREYIHVNWGENEICMIPYDDLDEILYTIFERSRKEGRKTRFVSTGQIFETEDEAREAMEERGH